MKKLLKSLIAGVALFGITTTSAWAQEYLQQFNSKWIRTESLHPVPYGNVWGEDIETAGIEYEQLYLKFKDRSGPNYNPELPPYNPNNCFVGGYFQEFGGSSATRDFTGMTLSVDVKQVLANGDLNAPPEKSFFFFELGFDSNGDGKFTDYYSSTRDPNDSYDLTYRTNLGVHPFILPGTEGTTFSIDLTQENFNVFDLGDGGFDLTKVARIGFGILQRVPDNEFANFPDNEDFGWKFDNLRVAMSGVDDALDSVAYTTLDVEAVPEPGTYAIMAMGLLGIGAFLRRRK